MKIQKPHETFYNWWGTTPDEEIWRVNWPDFDLPYCGVYVITPDKRWPCKIGISISPMKRLASIQTSVWLPVTVSGYRWCVDTKSARAIERAAHKELKRQSRELFGEWFDVRPPDALEVMDRAAMEMGVQLGAGVPAGRDDIKSYLEQMINAGWLKESSTTHQLIFGRSDKGIYDAGTGKEVRL